MSDLAQAIYQGKVGVEGAAGLRNPLVKMTTVAAPLMVVLFQHIARVFGSTRFSSAEIVMIAIICYITVTIDFEGKYFNRFISRSAKWASFVLIVFVFSLPTYEQYQEYLAFFGRAFHLLYAAMTLFIDSESLMTILLFVPMYLAIRNFTTRDALWIGRKFLWGLIWNAPFEIYMIVIITVAVINSALPLRISVSWTVAKDKAMLLKNPHLEQLAGLFYRLRTIVRLFSATLIGHNTRLAYSIETMTHQRGMFRKSYRDEIAISLSTEDKVALLLFAVGAVALVVGRLH
jgi:hypothetical protein